jgi:hypothetical protein
MSKADDFPVYIERGRQGDNPLRLEIQEAFTDSRALEKIKTQESLMKFLGSPQSKTMKEEVKNLFQDFLYWQDRRRIEEN